MSNAQDKNYDLEDRMAKFGEEVLVLCRDIRPDHITRPLITQLVKCSTSIGANYCEADDAVSKKDFKNKIGIAKKEARETKLFIRMLSKVCPDKRDTLKELWSEAKELHLIFNSIYSKV